MDFSELQETGLTLLNQTFGEGDASDREQLVSQGIKLHNMLRSPRFSQEDGNRESIGFSSLFPFGKHQEFVYVAKCLFKRLEPLY